MIKDLNWKIEEVLFLVGEIVIKYQDVIYALHNQSS